MKKDFLNIIPFLVLFGANFAAIRTFQFNNIASAMDLIFAVVPLLTCVYYYSAKQKKALLLSEIGLILHVFFCIYLGFSLYYTFIRRIITANQINQSLGYKIGYPLVIIFVVIILIMFITQGHRLKDKD